MPQQLSSPSNVFSILCRSPQYSKKNQKNPIFRFFRGDPIGIEGIEAILSERRSSVGSPWPIEVGLLPSDRTSDTNIGRSKADL
jgi:hypothetical protein